MSDFIPVNPKIKHEPVHLRLSTELAQALEQAVEKTGIKRSELIRQMIADCLSRMGIETSEKNLDVKK